jgi:hypothetical protein
MAIQCAAVDIHLSSAGNGTNFVAGNASFTIAVWIYADWTITGTSGSFVGLYGPQPTPTSAIQIGRRSGFPNQVSCWTWGGASLVQSTVGSIASNTWQFVTYTFDGTTHRVYVNGVLSNTSTTVPNAVQMTTVYINGYPTGVANETSTHKVDSYTYYNRTLSDDEIMTMYRAQGSRHGIVHGLIAAYEFDGGIEGSTVTTVKDFSGNGNDLTSSGAGASPITNTYTDAVASSNFRRVL